MSLQISHYLRSYREIITIYRNRLTKYHIYHRKKPYDKKKNFSKWRYDHSPSFPQDSPVSKFNFVFVIKKRDYSRKSGSLRNVRKRIVVLIFLLLLFVDNWLYLKECRFGFFYVLRKKYVWRSYSCWFVTGLKLENTQENLYVGLAKNPSILTFKMERTKKTMDPNKRNTFV